MIYVDDPTPALVRNCQNYLDGPGFFSEKLSPPRQVRGEWGRTPAQAAAAAAAIAAAQTQAKAAASARAGAGFHSYAAPCWTQTQASKSPHPMRSGISA